MALVNTMSPITILQPFELFSNLPIQTSIVKTRIDEIRPISQLNTGGYLEFDIPSNFNEYTVLDEIYLHVNFRTILSKNDKSAIALSDWENVSMVNNIIHSLWNQVDMSINDIQTTISLLTYSQKAYFNALLNSTKAARDTILSLAGFYHDDEKTHYDHLSAKRTSLIEHHKVTEIKNKRIEDAAKSPPVTTVAGYPTLSDAHIGKICQLSGKPALDLFNQYKYLIGGTKLRLKFVCNKPEYIFMIKEAGLNARIEFLDVYLEVPKVTVSDELLIAHNEAINVSPAKYPISRFEVRCQTIDKGITSKNIEHVINGQLPKKLYVTLVENEAYTGSYRTNPFLYKHFDLCNIACFVDGIRFEYQPDFNNRLVNKEYLGLLKTANQADNSARMLITKRNFEFGFTIYGFNIGQDTSEGFGQTGYANPPVKGKIRFELQFKNPTPQTLNVLFFCDYDNMISITPERNPIVDY